MANDRLSSIGARLAKAVREAGGLSLISQRVGVSSRSISRYISAETEMPILAAQELAAATNVSLNWLLTGQDVPAATERIVEANEDLILVPFLSLRASAGPGATVDEIEVLGSIPYSRSLLRRYGVNPENAEALTNRGDSMAPTIEDGQVILVDRSVRQVRQDAIYVVSIDHDIRVKRIQKSIGGALTLKSDNPAYAPELLSAADAAKLKIEGRVFLGERLL